MQKKIAAVIIIYKFPERKLEVLIRAIVNSGIKRKDIFIRDNTDDNIGYGSAINEVIKKQIDNYEAFLILNPDIKLDNNCIKKLTNTLFSSDTIGVVGPKFLDQSGKILALGGEIDKIRYSGGLIGLGRYDSKNNKQIEVDFASGGSMMVKAEVFKKVGLFDEKYFLYYEEVDFCTRARKQGFKIVTNPKAIVTHFASTTIGEGSPAMIYYLARNRLYFMDKFAPVPIKVREIIRLPKTLFQARENKYELLGIRDFFLRKTGKNELVKVAAD